MVHVGPHKTGTTALQSAYHPGRVALARQGVHYLGAGQQPAEAVLSLQGRAALRGEIHTRDDAWHHLVDEARAAGGRRVVLSSEFLADCDAATARRVVEDLGADRTWVLVTLRPLWKIAPSQWQQYLQNAQRTPYESWLHQLLNVAPYDRPNPSFWKRHRHDRLVDLWAEAVGVDRVVVVVVDERDRTMLMRTVERLLELDEGTLTPAADRQNRALTRPEAEVLRTVNVAAAEQGWSPHTYAHRVRRGLVRGMKSRPAHPSEPPVRSPDWALERFAEIGAQIVDGLRRSGVTVVGDLPSLAQPPPTPPEDERAHLAHADTAAAAIDGVLRTGPGATGGSRAITEVPVATLLRALARTTLRVGLGRASVAVAARRHR